MANNGLRAHFKGPSDFMSQDSRVKMPYSQYRKYYRKCLTCGYCLIGPYRLIGSTVQVNTDTDAH